ncbi:MAG: HEAT repeat domain-containing protein [Proteobacteria bacterium]|nr:HEAT repeat domain-containing protein [Pseudomonadota bacterium]MCP4919201.1 HEAT repeat domain-containing protein [Pseudomonadota bacterium]
MTFFLLLLGTAFGSVTDDLSTAANQELDEAARMQAFNKLVLDWSNQRPTLEQIVADPQHDARERWVVVRVIGQTNDPAAGAVLLELLDDPMPAMRAGAASALGDLGDKKHAEAIGALLQDDAMFVRAAAADALGAIGAESSAAALEAALKNSSNYYRGSSLWVRTHYVSALGAIGSESSIPALVLCFDDKDDAVVDASLVALRAIVGYDFAEGRTKSEHIEAWRRWVASDR